MVFAHSNVGFFGQPAGGMSPNNLFDTILGAFQDAIGPSGTLVLPTFTYSFSRGEPFNPEVTKSTCGVFTEMLRRHPEALRSHDPFFSVAAIGTRAREMTVDAPEDSFGPESFFDRFARAGGTICNLNFDAGSAFVHYVEKRIGVPYRYDKSFVGTLGHGEREEQRRAIIYVHDLTRPELEAAFEPFDRLARAHGLVRTANVGRGMVVAITAADTEALIRETLPERPWLLTQAEKMGIVPDLRPKIGPAPYTVPKIDTSGSPPALVASLVSILAPLPCQGVGPGVDAAFEILRQVLPLTLRRLPTGTWLGNELVPERRDPDPEAKGCFGALTVGEFARHGKSGSERVVAADLGGEDARAAALAAVLFRIMDERPMRSNWHLLIHPRPFAAESLVEIGLPVVTLDELAGGDGSIDALPASEVLERLLAGITRLDALG